MARTLSLELGSHAVKVVSWAASTDEPPEAEVLQTLPQDGEVVPTLADRLVGVDRVLRAHPDWASGAHVVAVWPAERTTVHRLKLPFDDAERIAQTLPFTLEAEVPFDLDPMVVAWRPGGSPGEVLVALARRDEVEAWIEGLEERGLPPRKLVLAGDVLSAYADPGLDPDRVSAVVDVGHENTVVAIVRGGRTLQSRAFGVAGRQATRAIQAALGCSFGQAQALKHGDEAPPEEPPPGDDEAGPALFDTSDDPSTQAERTDPALGRMPQKAKEALDGVVGLLLAEIRSTLVAAEDELGVGIDEVVLCGGGARLPDLRRWLEEDLGLPVRAPTTLDGSLVPDAFAVARAAASTLGSGASPVLDLRVDDLAYKGGFDNLRLVLGYGAAFLAFFLVAAVVSFGVQLYRLGEEQAAVEARVRDEVAAFAGEVSEELPSGEVVSLLADLVVEAQTEAEFLGSTDEAPPTVELLYQLTKNFPPHPDVKVQVDLVDISPRAVRVEGTTESFAQVDRIGESLTASRAFASVEASPGNKDGSGRLAFTVDLAREGEEDEDTDAGTAGDADLGEEG